MAPNSMGSNLSAVSPQLLKVGSANPPPFTFSAIPRRIAENVKLKEVRHLQKVFDMVINNLKIKKKKYLFVLGLNKNIALFLVHYVTEISSKRPHILLTFYTSKFNQEDVTRFNVSRDL